MRSSSPRSASASRASTRPTSTMTYKVFRAFNQWLDDDWGYDYANRLYSAPAIPVLDPQLATEELERVLERARN